MHRQPFLLFAIVAATLCLPMAQAQTPGTAFAISRAGAPITVDGVLDESVWQNALAIDLPWEWAPADNGPAVVKTTCLLTFDDDNIYLGFRAEDPDPSRIRARFADRDSAFLDDTVGFFLDPFNDGRRGFQFRINALGIQMDGVNSDLEGSEDWAWDAIWDSAGKIGANGYVVEVALPFRQLRFPPPSARQTWGFLAFRDYPRSVRHRFRSLKTDRERDCLICQFQKVEGFEGMETGRNLEVTPTVTGKTSERRADFPSGDFETTDEELEPGLSARWGITDSTSLNLAINPDFSQVEADAAQLDVNTRFALNFPEKRPFFLEGADFFETRFDLVFTRTVADPAFGLKLTGKTGAHAYGGFITRDRLNNLILPGAESSDFVSFDEDVDSAVLRYRRDLKGNNNLGLLYTGRRSDGYHNHVVAFDGVYRPTEQDSVRGQIIGSTTRYPDELGFEDDLDGHGLALRYFHSANDWTYSANFEQLSPEFRGDAGFFPQVGIRAASTSFERVWRGRPEQANRFSNLILFVGADAIHEWQGDWEEWGSDVVFIYEGPRQSRLELALAPNQEYFDGVTYQNLRWNFESGFDPSDDIKLSFNVRGGESIDFANSRGGDFVTISPRVEWHLGRRFYAELQLDRQTFDVDGGRLFTFSLAQSKLLYHFNRRTFLRAIFQYRDVERDPTLYTSPIADKDERLLTQLLFSYKVNPQTVFLIGYSDNYRGFEDVNLTQLDRTLFLKVGYAWLP